MTVVFDLGGVLVDWDPRYLFRQLLDSEAEVEHLLAEVTTPAWNLQQDAGRSWDEAVASLSAQHPEHAASIRAYRDRWPEMLGGALTGTVEVLDELRGLGVPLYALTNWSAETFPEAQRRFDFLSWFDGVVVSGREGVVKPDPALFRVLADRYRVDLTGAVFVDDVPANVEAARSLGMTGLLFVSPERLRADLVTLGLLPAPTRPPSGGVL